MIGVKQITKSRFAKESYNSINVVVRSSNYLIWIYTFMAADSNQL